MEAIQNQPIPDRSRPGLTTAALATGRTQGGGGKYATGYQTQMNLPKIKFITATWNVRTLSAPGKLEQLRIEMARYEWNVIGICEMRWTGVGEMTLDDGQKLWWCGEDTKHQRGVGLMVKKEVVPSVMECKPISSRIITMRIAAKPRNLTIIQVYAPTSNSSEADIEEFYEVLENVMRNTHKRDYLIVQGDWNCQIGCDAGQTWRGTAGRFGYAETNERGQLALQFAAKYQLVVSNTLFPNKKSRCTTWHSPNSRDHCQIDYIMLSKRLQSGIVQKSTRTFPGADVGSDHDLVMMGVQLKLRKTRKITAPMIRYDVAKLKDPLIAEQFEAEIGGKFAPLLLIEGVQEQTTAFTEKITETAMKVLGKRKATTKPWITNKLIDQCEKRRNLKGRRFESTDDMERYREANRFVKKEVKNAKEKWINEQCTTIENNLRRNPKEAYETVKKLTEKSSIVKSPSVKDKNGEVLSETGEVLKRWKEYCHELYNHQVEKDEQLLNEMKEQAAPSERTPPILMSEIESAINNLKNNKAPGFDNIPGELLKYGGKGVRQILHSICNKVLESGSWPAEWTKSVLIPIPKKSSLKCQDHRTISLISHASKVLLKILQKRLQSALESTHDQCQAGFRAGRSTSEQVCNLRNIYEKYTDHNCRVYSNFVDYKKAFDRVWHDGLWAVLQKHGVDTETLALLKSLYANSESAVRVGVGISDFFKCSVGVRQGCILSPLLFNVFLEELVTRAVKGFEGGVRIHGVQISNLRFADDIVLLGSSQRELKDLTERLDGMSRRMGMEISAAKSKLLVVGEPKDDINGSISLSGETIEQVPQFKYLGCTIDENGKSTKEVKIRIAMAKAAMWKLSKVWSSGAVLFKTKLRLVRSIVISVLLYGCEAWTYNEEIEKKVQALELWCYRRLLGIKWTDRRTNVSVIEEIELKAGSPQRSILEMAKERKMKFFGHVTRHPHELRLTHTIMHGRAPGSRRQGRPKRSWSEDISRWTRKQLAEVMRIAEDRDEWRRMCFHCASTDRNGL